MILGILSPLCCGLLTGIPALILGRMGRREIDQSGGTQGGRGMATAGVVLGIIGIVLSILSALLFAGGLLSFDSGLETTTP